MYIALRWYHSIINNLSAYISCVITSCSFDSIPSSHLDFYLQKPSPGLCLLSLYLPWVPGIDFSPSPSLYSFLPFNPLILFNAILASLILIKKLCMIKQYSSLFFLFGFPLILLFEYFESFTHQKKAASSAVE